MEDPIVEINERVNDMQVNEEEYDMGEDLPPFYSDGSTFRDFLRRLGLDPDHVLDPENRKLSTIESGYVLVPEGRSGCFRAVGPDAVKRLIVPCAVSALADFNNKHNTDYKLDDEGYNDACLRQKSRLGCYHVHCNFSAKPETKPLKDGNFYPREFFADADQERDGSINLNSYSLIDYAKINYGCEMCPFQIRHPTC